MCTALWADHYRCGEGQLVSVPHSDQICEDGESVSVSVVTDQLISSWRNPSAAGPIVSELSRAGRFCATTSR